MTWLSGRRTVLVTCCAALIGLLTAGTALAGHPRPKGATPKRDSLVIAYAQCTAPNSAHGPSLGTPSCAPPTPTSAWLTVGDPVINGNPANFIGSSRLDVCPSSGCVAPDIRITISMVDVRCTPALATATPPVCAGGSFSAYTGSVRVRYLWRITDHCNVPGPSPCGGTPATLLDIPPFAFSMPCVPGAPGAGATCSIATTANSVLPGAIVGGQRMNIRSHVEIDDGGMDGNANTGPDTLFVEEGVFVP